MNKSDFPALIAFLFLILLFASCGGCKSANQPSPALNTALNDTSSENPDNPLKYVGILYGLDGVPIKIGMEKKFIHALPNEISRNGVHHTLKAEAFYIDLVSLFRDEATRGNTLKIVALCSREGYSLVVRDDEYKSPIELVSYAVAIYNRFKTSSYFLDRFFKQHKLNGRVYLDYDSVEQVRPSSNAKEEESTMHYGFEDAFYDLLHKHRTIAGFVDDDPIVARVIQKKNTGILVSSKDVAPNHPTTCLAVSEEMIKDHPEAVRKLVSGHIQSIRWVNAHPEETAQWVAAHYKIGIEEAKDALSRIKYDYRFNAKELEDLVRFVDEMEYGQIENPAAFVTANVDTSFLPDPLPAGNQVP
jgi:hypothetical protein